MNADVAIRQDQAAAAAARDSEIHGRPAADKVSRTDSRESLWDIEMQTTPPFGSSAAF